jgi:hypothetical protein
MGLAAPRAMTNKLAMSVRLWGLLVAFACPACAAPVVAQQEIRYDIPAPGDSNFKPRPGTAPVTFSSVADKLPLDLSANSGAVPTTWRGHTFMADHYVHLCKTPCTVFMVPGKFNFRVDGDTIRTYGDAVNVPPTGADVKLGPSGVVSVSPHAAAAQPKLTIGPR